MIVALDYASVESVFSLVDKLEPRLCKLKVGKELFTATGPDLVRTLVDRGYDLFLDLKFHDIPTTVARAVAAAADLGVWMVNVHASGGRKMMEAAAQQLQAGGQNTLLTAVTVLTSLSAADLRETGINAKPLEQVLRLARLAADSGLSGVVCSAWEAVAVAGALGDEFIRVTPGIRSPSQAGNDDQSRTMAPASAIAAGSSYLVIGRPITRAADPRQVLLAIREEIGDY